MKAYQKQKKTSYLKQGRITRNMKQLSRFNKFIFVCNRLSAILLLAACVVPYVSLAQLSFLSFLGLGVPLLVVVNALSVVYWLLKWKRQLWLSFAALILSYFSLGTFFKLQLSEREEVEGELKVMSYNVRGFNKFNEIDNSHVFEDVKEFVGKQKPDIICFQEPDYRRIKEYKKDYPYQYLEYIYMEGKVLLGFLSKYPIIKSDQICFPDSSNNAAFVDILYKNDTIRVYNVHLQSLGVTPGRGVIRNQRTDRLFRKLSKKFAKQQKQAKMVADHMKGNAYKQILCGDFNSTQYSNPYHTLKGDKNDSFMEKGSGYGGTLSFHKVPVRIDFILADKAFEVKTHKNYDVKYSDHFPVMASFDLKSEIDE